MTSKQSYQQNLNPPPPRDISQENLGIWMGWTYRSDRELVREAASKGHVPLAKTFLSRRKNIGADSVTKYINTEVFSWVDELLDRKLIFRVSSILENIGVDPSIELQNIFCKTTKADWREYIGSHLKSQNVLPASYEQLWTFLDIIIENKVLTHHNSLLEDSIENLDKKSDVWKDLIAAKLFLTTHDARLIPLVKGEVLWNELLATNEVHLLRAWIQIAYSSHTDILNIPENFITILKSFPVTEDMIKCISSVKLPKDSFEKVLNELVQFGIFIESEKTSLLTVLSRINAANTILNVYEILGHRSSNLPLIKFVAMLTEYCLENNLLSVLNSCTSDFDLKVIPKLKDSPHVNLMLDFRDLVPDFEEGLLRDNIFNVAKYLCKGDLEKYFSDNPMVFLSLLVLTKEICIETSINQKSLILNNIEFHNCLSNVMKQFKLLSSLYFRHTREVKCSIIYFDLIEKHLKIDVRKAFEFYFEGKPLPNFKSPELREGFAYSKEVNYTFHLKQCRPSIASKKYFLDLLKSSQKIDDEAKTTAKQKVYKIAIKQFQNIALTTTCITFLEIIGISSEFLRVSLKGANILFQSGMDVDNVISLFLNVQNDPRVIQTLLDENLIKFIDFSGMMSCASEFVKAVKIYDIVIKFSLFYNLSLPETFLRHLAQNNQWFPFLLYAQLKNYPVLQIKEICSNFKNPTLLEHIVHSVLHDIQVDETNVLMRQRDSRQYLLSKLGVRRSVDESSVACGSMKSKSTISGSLESSEFSSGSEFLEIDISNTKATLLQILIRCHDSSDPPRALLQASQLYRNPLLAILATSYEPDSVITSWLTWLAASTDLYEIFTNFVSVAFSSQEVANLLDNCIKSGYPKTLFQSCIIFIPDNPLTPFCDFLNRVISRDYNINYLIPKLEKFKALKTNRRASVLSQTDYEMTYLKNKVWIETTALQLLCSAIIFNPNSLFDQLEFAELLCRVNIQEFFSCEVPTFENLVVILRTIFDTGIKLDLVSYMNPSKEKIAIKNCVDELANQNLFSEALTVAKCFSLNTDMIVLKKWQNIFESRKHSIEDFLLNCNDDFEAHKVSSEYVISFYKERLSVNELERYYLLKFSHKWAANHDLPNRFALERKKILAFVKIEDKPMAISELDDLNVDKNYTTYKELLTLIEAIQSPLVSLTTDYLDRLNAISIEALDKRNFWLALKLERMFGCKSNDLDILKLCHELAEGLVLPNQLNDDQQQVIERVKDIQKLSHRRRSLYKSPSMSTDRNYLEMIEEEAEPSSHVIQGIIHTLIEKLTHGSELAYSVFMKYRISSNIGVPYDIIVLNTDPLKMLKDALQDDCLNKLEVVHDFLEVFGWSKEEVTDFVCDQFITAASSYTKSKIDVFSMWDIKVGEQFHLVLQLIKDECSTLGYKFFNYSTAIHQQQITANDMDFKISEMSLVVELLIAAHSCFTADCNMEGISIILKKCRTVISHLLYVRSWKLIVRLLTGVGRYTELNFVFNILKENDQFEFLLSKGSKRDERLKLACIEYLKKYCPQNKKLYESVAIYFNLYSEVAFVWEREAHGCIKNLVAIAKVEMQNSRSSSEPIDLVVLTKSDGTKMLLHKAMERFVNAAEFHTQGEKLTKAMNAVKQAELIALQKALLTVVNNNETVPCLLHLSNSNITKLMTTELNFHQSNLLAQSYNFSPDWPQILYEQAIVNNNITYFDQFAETIGLSDELVQDISRKFVANQVFTDCDFQNRCRNIKHIIEQVESVHIKYRLASELGFNSLVSNILESGEISYLKDTVYKSGYKDLGREEKIPSQSIHLVLGTSHFGSKRPEWDDLSQDVSGMYPPYNKSPKLINNCDVPGIIFLTSQRCQDGIYMGFKKTCYLDLNY